MAVTEAMKHYDERITNMQTVLEAKLDSGLKNIEAGIKGFDGRMAGMDGKIDGFQGQLKAMQSTIDMIKWMVIIQTGIMASIGVIATAFKAFG